MAPKTEPRTCGECEHWGMPFEEQPDERTGAKHCGANIPIWLIPTAERVWPDRGCPLVSADSGEGCECFEPRTPNAEEAP